MSNNFEKCMKIAEFAQKNQQDRRQYEFKIFISYVTLLALGIWKTDDIGGFCYILGSLVGFSYLLYLLWQIRVSIANRNDGYRRDYYLEKAEDILYPDWAVEEKLPNEYRDKKCFLNPKIKIIPKIWQVCKN